MDRLTLNKPGNEMEMYERFHNKFYFKDGEAWYRDYDTDIPCRDLVRKIAADFDLWEKDNLDSIDDDIFDGLMICYLEYGQGELIGLLASYYNTMWTMADLWERLSAYEDTGLTPDQINALHRPGNTALDIKTKICEAFCKYPSHAENKEELNLICAHFHLAELIQSVANVDTRQVLKDN